ncbi:hypothetical protein WA588_002609 [Blastocystis sp. NMH]
MSSLKSSPFGIQLRRSFATEAAAKTAEKSRGPLASVFSFLPRWGAPGFWRKLGFYFCLILVVNGLITVGYYTFDHCYGLFMNDHGKWSLKSDIYRHYHQLELVLNFPAALDFVLDPAPLPPPPSSAYIAITPVLNEPGEGTAAAANDPYKKKVDMSIVNKATEKKPVEIAKSSTGTSTVVSNKPIVSKTTEGYQTIYRSTSETIMPFIPVICLYFGDGICPRAYELFKHRDNQDYLNIQQIPYFIHLFNSMENTIKWEHRSLYGVLLFNRFMKHSFHNNLVNLDYSYNEVNGKALSAFFEYASNHKLKFRKLKRLDLEGNHLTDFDIRSFCKYSRAGAYRHLSFLSLKNNHITELGLLQLCILLEEGFLPNLIEIDVDNNNIDPSSLGYRTLMGLLQKNMEATTNESSVKIVTTYQLSDQHLSINSKVILQMFTKLTAKWNQLSRQMKFM